MSQSIFSIALRSILPPIFFLLSGLVFTLALYTRGSVLRSTLFGLIILLSIQSIEHARGDFGVFKPFVGHWTQVISNQVLHATAILFVENYHLDHLDIKTDAILWQGRRLIGYKLWNNVRRLPAPTLRATQNNFQSEPLRNTSVYFLFYASGAAKLVLIYLVNSYVLPLLVRGSLVELQAQDLSPQKQVLFRRIHDVTAREVVIRSYFGALWAWRSYSSFESLHIMVSWCFVSIGYDSPEEWPPLFGNLSEATSLRRFWASFWHQLIVPTYRAYGDAIAAHLGLKLGSQASQTVIAVAVFGISGLAHGFTGYVHGSSAWTWNIWWFWLNFVACLVETVFVAVIRTVAKRLCLEKELRVITCSWFGYLFGYAYVAAFFFWSVPKWLFPDLYVSAILVESFRNVFAMMLHS